MSLCSLNSLISLHSLTSLISYNSYNSYNSYCSILPTLPTLSPFFTPRLSLLPYVLSYSRVRIFVPVNIKAIKVYKGLGRVRDLPLIHLNCPYFALFNITAELALTNSAVIYFAYRQGGVIIKNRHPLPSV